MQEKENWCNTTAYPVESIYWEGKSILELMLQLFFLKLKSIWQISFKDPRET